MQLAATRWRPCKGKATGTGRRHAGPPRAPGTGPRTFAQAGCLEGSGLARLNKGALLSCPPAQGWGRGRFRRAVPPLAQGRGPPPAPRPPLRDSGCAQKPVALGAGWGTCWDKDLSLEGGEENSRRRAGGLGGTAPGLKATAKGAPVRREQRASRRIRRQLIRRLEMLLAARGTAAQPQPQAKVPRADGCHEARAGHG